MVEGPGAPREGVVGTHCGCEFRINTGKKRSIAIVSAFRENRTLKLPWLKTEELFISNSVVNIPLCSLILPYS
jgi:hypothetical protein